MKKWRWITLSLMLVGVILASGVGINANINVGNKVITIGNEAYALGADYTFNGNPAHDTAQMLAALNALPSTGGRIEVLTCNVTFNANITRATDNITIEGVGVASYFGLGGGLPVFTAGGNNWVFSNLRTDGGGINMGATTGWIWNNVTIGAIQYAYRASSGLTYLASANINNLTSGRVPITGIGGLLGDDAGLTFDGTSLQVSGANVTRTATYVVATSDAPAYIKAQADYVLTGIGDVTTINSLIGVDRLIQLTQGTYYVGTPIINNANNCGIQGVGWGTKLVLTDNVTMFSVYSAIGTRLSNMALDGQKALGYTSNATLLQSLARAEISNLYIHDFGGSGIVNDQLIGSLSYSLNIRGNYICDNNGHGIYLSYEEGARVIGNNIEGSGKSNIYLDGFSGYSTVIGNVVNSAVDYGIGIIYSTQNTIVANVVLASNKHGIWVLGTHNSIAGNNIDDSSNTNNNVFDGINISALGFNTIIGNTIKGHLGSQQRYGIYLDIGTNTVMGNTITDVVTGGIGQAGGISNIVRGNIGYVTENSGIALGTGAEQTIPHGLSYTPSISDIGIWSDNTTAGVWQTTIPDTNNIYVTCNVSGSAWHWATVGK
jgi:hypothetical protein